MDKERLELWTDQLNQLQYFIDKIYLSEDELIDLFNILFDERDRLCLGLDSFNDIQKGYLALKIKFLLAKVLARKSAEIENQILEQVKEGLTLQNMDTPHSGH
jgi:hypothetical protein